jgi:RHS repeat-associated protein
VALADGSGTVQTEYAYEPFGSTTTSGSSTTSAYGFTGREADGTGLYYYRARYYDVRLQRFAGEDPIGFAAGDANLHAYVWNAPTLWADPTGLLPYKPLWDPCNPKSGKTPPAWLAFLCREDVQIGIDIAIGMAGAGRGGAGPAWSRRGFGGSGRPRQHNPHYSSKKAAREAAQRSGKGPPEHHAHPDKGNPHYHSTDETGEIIKNGVHHNYPRR